MRLVHDLRLGQFPRRELLLRRRSGMPIVGQKTMRLNRVMRLTRSKNKVVGVVI